MLGILTFNADRDACVWVEKSRRIYFEKFVNECNRDQMLELEKLTSTGKLLTRGRKPTVKRSSGCVLIIIFLKRRSYATSGDKDFFLLRDQRRFEAQESRVGG